APAALPLRVSSQRSSPFPSAFLRRPFAISRLAILMTQSREPAGSSVFSPG
ncbi:Hypothetical predicted protein, partial [Pelobates cultripes]